MTETPSDPASVADEIAAARAAGGRLEPFTGRIPGFGLDEACRVAGILACRRAALSPVVGRKIGFTNRALWEAAGLDRIVWGSMFEDTVIRSGRLPMAGAVEPKIECEVVVVLAAALPPGGRGAQVASCLAAVGLGSATVDSPFPGWRMRPADAVAAGGIHHALAVGPLVRVTDPEAREETLAELAVSMTRGGAEVAEGARRLVLGNPLDAVGALQAIATGQRTPLAPGEIITTGTLTPPLPAPGEYYRGEAADGVLPAAEVQLV